MSPRTPPLALLLLLALTAAARAEGDPAKGEQVFRRCKACHTLGAGEGHRIGPNLHGLFGRAAGAAEGYGYSRAMQATAVVWDEQTLDAYLADPRGFVPGNKMAFAGLKREAERADVIAYLKGATAD